MLVAVFVSQFVSFILGSGPIYEYNIYIYMPTSAESVHKNEM